MDKTPCQSSIGLPECAKEQMNILLFSQYFWPENFRINDVVQDLLKEQISVEVVTAQPNYPQGKVYAGYSAWKVSEEKFEEAVIHRLPIVARGTGSAVRLILNYLSFVLSGLLFAPFLLRKKSFDVVFVYAPSPLLQAIPAILTKWIKGARVVIWVQDLWPESLEATGFVRHPWALALVRTVVRWIYRHADLILVQSEAFIEPVAALSAREKIRYFPNPAGDVFSVHHPVLDCLINIPDDGFSIVFAGNLGSAQSLETIVEAAVLLKDVPEIRIFLVGDGSRAEWVREQVAARGLLNVVMTGMFPIEAMPAILRRADALLVTLKDEGIFSLTVPSKIQAYLAMGRPIIACLNGEGARLVETAGAGISCAAEDAHALATAIRQIYQAPLADREQFGRNGIAYFETHFDSRLLTKLLISYLENITLGGRGGESSACGAEKPESR